MGASPSSAPSRMASRPVYVSRASGSSRSSRDQSKCSRGRWSPHSTVSTWSVTQISSSPARTAASASSLTVSCPSGDVAEWV